MHNDHGDCEEDPAVLRRYQEAVEQLNTLQSNATTLSKVVASGQRSQSTNVEDMRRRLKRCGLEVADLNKLNVIHVSGTKGKGSTCAYAESLLRHRGLKTGFYSSPHLIEVRERIRINGQPLSKEKFVKHFWRTYSRLDDTKDQENGAMPPYFSFLTLLGFQVFLEEEVDVTVLEVGIGGRFDCTNVIAEPVACGVTSLGHDHMSILGRSLEEIAWNKAGIVKDSCAALFTCDSQPEPALKTLEVEAAKLQKKVVVAPSLDSYPLPASCSLHLGIGGSVQRLNASLALQLTNCWLRWRAREDNSTAAVLGQPFPLDELHLLALSKTRWFGRCTVLEHSPRLRFHLDGAHTPESIAFSARWFQDVAEGPRVLVFNVLGERDARSMLTQLQGLKFDFAIFCPNIVHADSSSSPDASMGNPNVLQCSVSRTSQVAKCQKLLEVWREVSGCPARAASCVGSVEEALSFLEAGPAFLDECPEGKASVLVTGSLHLVGDFFALLSPGLIGR